MNNALRTMLWRLRGTVKPWVWLAAGALVDVLLGFAGFKTAS